MTILFDDVRRFHRNCVLWAGVLGTLGVVIGAFGAHGLPALLERNGLPPELIAKRMDQLDVGVRYHLLHAVALLALPVASQLLSLRVLRAVAMLLLLGVLLFSGSLYVLVVLNQPKLGMVTPLGGLSLIAGWLVLTVGAFRKS